MTLRRIATLCVLVLAILHLLGCEDATTNTTNTRFATAESLVEHLNSVAEADGLRMRHLAELYYAETEFQRSQLEMFNAIAGAETLLDACFERFGETLDEGDEDLRIFLGFEVFAVMNEEAERASAAVVRGSGDVREFKLVKISDRWWISGYTWEYAMSDAHKAEAPRRSLIYQVDAEIAGPLLSRLHRNEFATASDLRAAHRQAILDYFEAHPDRFEQITGKPFRRQ